ncbi:hypothetical protein FA95DRAFT_1607268 [Auriscalpium vulgare]|uniref:Uncharacterized protein n=1 Tax=Auriscalpium vulgare TaxID=40419 RepID=A0ACB8RQ98_9AGAM|nr:hypothetical protein FA95DRAFT_1607268 [Auriscalpium vulgare]
MATFGGMEPSGLAQAFRHFILPVYPNRFTTGRDHVVRATVNWDKKTQWLVAFPLQTQEYLLPRQWIQHSTRTQMQVNRKELLAVTRQCAIKRAVRDLVVLSALRKDYLARAFSGLLEPCPSILASANNTTVDHSFFDGSNTTTGGSAEGLSEFASIPWKRKASGPQDDEKRPKRKRSKSKSAHMD